MITTKTRTGKRFINTSMMGGAGFTSENVFRGSEIYNKIWRIGERQGVVRQTIGVKSTLERKYIVYQASRKENSQG